MAEQKSRGVEGKSKFALWLTPEAKTLVETHYETANCRSQSEFIEKAIRFYTGYLDTQRADAYLPRVLAQLWEGQFDMFGDRIGRLLFKYAVEHDMGNHLLAADTDIDQDTLERRAAAVCARCAKQTAASRSKMHCSFKNQFEQRLCEAKRTTGSTL